MTNKLEQDKDNLDQEIMSWVNQSLLSHGYILKNHHPECILDTPWSSIVRFMTTKGYVYLKKTPPLLALEAPIIDILFTHFKASVPQVIACNTDLYCFLMKDAGRSLREVLKKRFDPALFCKAIEQFSLLQLATAEDIDMFLKLGVPDWRLNKFLDLYLQLLAQKDILIADSVSETELLELNKLASTVSSLCKKLSSYSIPQTIVQPDFNDNNLLIDKESHRITLIDLGEITISHPFFSLLNGLKQIKKHHALSEQDGAYLQIKEACFKHFTQFESQERLLEALDIARLLYLIYGAFGHYRLMMACERFKFKAPFQGQGRPGISLQEFITACNERH